MTTVRLSLWPFPTCDAGDNLHHLLAAQLGHDPSFYMLAAACVMIPTVWLPDVKTLSYLGFAGVAGTLSVAATVGLLRVAHICSSRQTKM